MACPQPCSVITTWFNFTVGWCRHEGTATRPRDTIVAMAPKGSKYGQKGSKISCSISLKRAHTRAACCLPSIIPLVAYRMEGDLRCSDDDNHHICVSSEEAPQLNIVSFNVNFGLSGCVSSCESAREALRSSPVCADVILIQENDPDWTQYLAEVLLEEYPFMEYHHSDRWVPGGSAIFSKLPIRSMTIVESPTGWFPTAVYCLDLSDTPHEAYADALQVINVHTRPPLSKWCIDEQALDNVFSLYPEFARSKADRIRDFQDVLKTLDPEMPTIYGGDFNEAHSGLFSGGLLRFMEEQGFDEALKELDVATKTWRIPLLFGMAIRAQFDFIGYQRTAMLPLAAGVIKKGNSDHYPVYATLQWLKQSNKNVI